MLKNRKQRPPNGPGANGLRGGTNLYSTKTTIGRWQDDIGGPSAFQRGFNTPEFETEAQHQQRGATLQAPSYYGSELSKTDDNEKTTDPVWETTARNMSIGNQKTVEDNYIPGSNMSNEKLEEYRRTWTSDIPASRDMRYQTESRRAGMNMPLKFQIASVRMLPGTPRALEKFREKLLERHGILAISAMRFHLGKGDIVRDELMSSIARMEVVLDKVEFNQILAYSCVLTCDEFIRRVIAKTDGFDTISPTPSDHFNYLFIEKADGIEIIDLLSKINTSEYYEVIDGLSLYLEAYALEVSGVILRKEFMLLLKDFYVSAPLDYATIMSTFFN